MVPSLPMDKHHQGKLILALAQIIMIHNYKEFYPELSHKCSRKCNKPQPSSSSESKYPWLKSIWKKSKIYLISPKMTSKSEKNKAKESICRMSLKNMLLLPPKPWNLSKEVSLIDQLDKLTWMIPPQDLIWPSSSHSIKIIWKMQVLNQVKLSLLIWQEAKKLVKLELKGNY